MMTKIAGYLCFAAAAFVFFSQGSYFFIAVLLIAGFLLISLGGTSYISTDLNDPDETTDSGGFFSWFGGDSDGGDSGDSSDGGDGGGGD